ncbi:MAG: hypothetical protein J6T64_09130 [Bacteroidaceae bacterium]|nr:hypothetical protein [Bacteroidaceae bacterium]
MKRTFNYASILSLVTLLLTGMTAYGQGILGGHVTGNIQLDGQISSADTVIGAQDVPENLLLNARADILYTNGGFSAGMRFEVYQNPLLGFDQRYKGEGIANYFVSYKAERLSVTAGNFYEQFGSGMILRAYEDRYLGIDNSLRGLDVALRPFDGVTVKAFIGKQRYFWSYGNGLVRGIDGEINLNSVIKAMAESKFRATLGAGFVSKYEDDETIISEDPSYKLRLPLNVGAGAVRMDLSYGNWSLQTEYARKGQDPSVMNEYIYRYGEALMVNATYAKKGFSANVQAKRVDNMSYKSVRSESGEMLYINYIPAITKQHTYAFLSMYPYATQTTGEMGLQGDIMYKIKKGTLLGGQYGTDIQLNAAIITGIDTNRIGGAGTMGYESQWFKTGELYYGDVTLAVAKKLSSALKLSATYGYQVFNPTVEGHIGNIHHNHIAVADLTWKVNKKNVLRFEAEWMGSDSKYGEVFNINGSDVENDDKRCGDWIMGLVEYNFAGSWFLSVSDQYAYNDGIGNYYNVSLGYTHGATRMQLGYGKQREGLLCIGGVCRQVPASNGLTFSLTTSF